MRITALLLVLALVVAACGGKSSPSAPGTRPTLPARPPIPAGPEPTRVVVDHILIAVANPRMLNIRRSVEEARDIAYDLVNKIKGGADFAELKRKNSDDPPPGGPYALVNRGAPKTRPGDFDRDGMVPAFGNVGFTLAVGDVWIAEFDPATSPYGFHIIKRVE